MSAYVDKSDVRLDGAIDVDFSLLKSVPLYDYDTFWNYMESTGLNDALYVLEGYSKVWGEYIKDKDNAKKEIDRYVRDYALPRLTVSVDDLFADSRTRVLYDSWSQVYVTVVHSDNIPSEVKLQIEISEFGKYTHIWRNLIELYGFPKEGAPYLKVTSDWWFSNRTDKDYINMVRTAPDSHVANSFMSDSEHTRGFDIDLSIIHEAVKALRSGEEYFVMELMCGDLRGCELVDRRYTFAVKEVLSDERISGLRDVVIEVFQKLECGFENKKDEVWQALGFVPGYHTTGYETMKALAELEVPSNKGGSTGKTGLSALLGAAGASDVKKSISDVDKIFEDILQECIAAAREYKIRVNTEHPECTRSLANDAFLIEIAYQYRRNHQRFLRDLELEVAADVATKMNDYVIGLSMGVNEDLQCEGYMLCDDIHECVRKGYAAFDRYLPSYYKSLRKDSGIRCYVNQSGAICDDRAGSISELFNKAYDEVLSRVYQRT